MNDNEPSTVNLQTAFKRQIFDLLLFNEPSSSTDQSYEIHLILISPQAID